MPANALSAVSWEVISPASVSAPRDASALSFSWLRATTLTFLPCFKRPFATTEPVFPVAPVIKYISSSTVVDARPLSQDALARANNEIEPVQRRCAYRRHWVDRGAGNAQRPRSG